MVKSRRSANQTPDLFEAAPSRAEQMKSHSVSPARTPYILPADLGSALRHLTDADLKQLATSVAAELERRNPPVATPAVIARQFGVSQTAIREALAKMKKK